ncbi:MAG: Nramp family divalent metal transporter [Exiguobacterium sp.]|jgi:manganese transport protein|uniref:Nramp family divalent metal transporter n=1 Tax=Exiguobacterium TaxID=33986 RepID=UPI000990F089|nr:MULTISPECIES: Nramp family divalent metal transporter [unclassified Exiguobacterium]MBQ6459613.1 Nramp family divalent metal transporter [Exiguobacterium sp.]MBR3063096.1 Nramp family divalent metal transporter [Exiguobacterium sp.]MCM3280732.1 Nramp family divalent metal transporter [Exiguobacterium sp. MER 193]
MLNEVDSALTHKSMSQKIKTLLPFLGPAFVASVAYIDPGNYATNIAAGSQFGYLLLWVILVANLMAGLIQTLSAKIGIATGKNLPEICRDRFSKKTAIFLWIQAELMIMATDLAEFVGAALGIYLVFDVTLIQAALLAAVGSFAILEVQRRGYRPLETIVTGMLLVVALAFAIQTFSAQPEVKPLLSGLLIPRFDGTESILLAAGILGATVMPHAIYLHSALTQRRITGKDAVARKRIMKFERIDVTIAMVLAGAINASMLIIAAAVFYKNGFVVSDLEIAHQQFDSFLGSPIAMLFGIGLMVAGLSSASVGTLAGDVVMQGYIQKHIPIYVRRVITMAPPLLLILSGVNLTNALVWSQVILSFGIAFALVPLLLFTSNKSLMGELVNHRMTTWIGWGITTIVIALNLFLIIQTFIF